ncbi:MAG: alanine--tRNA ligase [Planctomycetota bacterium]|nr:alanine--tRNA ligase [Planctomycetota bacterium]MDA1179585.1 alanine--tRNA ligase [Planctomycetota bacterium]
MKTDEIREKYLAFFESKGHTRRASDVIVPTWDASVLFTPAGMNQFKPHFLGKVKLEFTRATTCQKCLRTGDIDNVGRTAYHHTFFEMLGNFSFGDYFKREAIHWAWEFLTDPKWMGMDRDRLTVSVYLDDDEAANIWHEEIGLATSRIARMGEDDNFWPASSPTQGPDGVCGPCSEIFYHPASGPEVEVWNLVFTQFNRVGTPPDNLRPLPSKNIDTGMGLERIAAVMQGVDTNYHIDTLRPIVESAASICGLKYDPHADVGRRLRRIADHVRACVFAIHENVYPGPNKEKYVIRRLLRRAVLDGHQLGMRDPFLFQLVDDVARQVRTPYPELSETAQRVASVIRHEEMSFLSTIDGGLARMEKIFEEMRRDGHTLIDGHAAADLYTTYGVPPELFEATGVERKLTFGWDGFRDAMKRHMETGGSDVGVLFATGPIESLKRSIQHTEFLGYESTDVEAEVRGIVSHEHSVESISESDGADQILVVLDRTPFYGESGGQVGDTGTLEAPGVRLVVLDTQRDDDLILHRCRLESGTLRTGMKVQARVDSNRRDAIRRAHSATHILHYSLQKHLGKHAQQQGSKVDEDWLRFDFTNMEPVGDAVMQKILGDIRERVKSAASIGFKTLPLEEARSAGAMMLFGEKYPDPVRMVSMGDFSRELCGGIHLKSTDQVESFEILSEEGVSAGTRRIVALTGKKAREHTEKIRETLAESLQILGVKPAALPQAAHELLQKIRSRKKQLAGGGVESPDTGITARGGNALTDVDERQILRETARELNVGVFEVTDRLRRTIDELRQLDQQIQLRAAAGELTADTLLEAAVLRGETQVIVHEAPLSGAPLLRQLIDHVRKRTKSSAVLLATVEPEEEGPGKVTMVAGVSRDLVDRGVTAGDWIKHASVPVGGSGGGRPDMAQAGGKHPEKLPEALVAAREWITRQF